MKIDLVETTSKMQLGWEGQPKGMQRILWEMGGLMKIIWLNTLSVEETIISVLLTLTQG